MSNGVKISQLPDGGPTASSDFIPVERGSVTFKIPTNQFVIDGQNVATGAGAQLFIGKQTGAGSILQFRTLSGTDGISVVNIGNTTVVSGSGQNPIKTVFIGTGSQVDFPFPVTNTSSRNVNNYRVDIDGVLQEPGQTADYYLNGPNLTFTSAPPLSSKIVVVSNNLLPLAESVPPDNSVSTAKLSAGAVTTVKIALSAVTTSTLANRSVTTDKIALSAITIDRLGADIRFSIVPTGAIMPFYRPTAPDGWLICDGSAISTQYTALTALVGANTPNLRGMFIRGWSSGTSTTSRDPLSGSRTLGSVQEDAFESHNHSISPTQVPFKVNDTDRGVGNSSSFSIDSVDTLTIGSTGDTETRPVNVALLYCIKT